jgi:dephospho-CoA kinase
MLKVVLTGGIGSGKSVVTDLLSQLAKSKVNLTLSIIDADIIAQQLLTGSIKKPNISTALQKVVQLFGTQLFNSEGYLNRRALRTLIFTSTTKKKQLETLLHPLIYQEITTQLTQIKANIIIISIPLFFETNAHKKDFFDRILVVDSPLKLQLKRAQQRDHCSLQLLKKMIDSQIDRATRLSLADDIVDNSGSLSALKFQITSIFDNYCTLIINHSN